MSLLVGKVRIYFLKLCICVQCVLPCSTSLTIAYLMIFKANFCGIPYYTGFYRQKLFYLTLTLVKVRALNSSIQLIIVGHGFYQCIVLVFSIFYLFVIFKIVFLAISLWDRILGFAHQIQIVC